MLDFRPEFISAGFRASRMFALRAERAPRRRPSRMARPD